MSNKISRFSSGSEFEKAIGYARVVSDGVYAHVSGTTGYDYQQMTIADQVEAQATQCMRNVEEALQRVGCGFADVVRVRYLFPNREDFALCMELFKAHFGAHPPAATLQICDLHDPAMRLEVEVTAKIPAA